LTLVLFADGCFYHCCPKHGHHPKSNQDYWVPKLARNCKRDRSNRRRLRGMGLSVWRFWEHDLKGSSIKRTYGILERRLLRRIEAADSGPLHLEMSRCSAAE
jgi:DNA mismatch endonuclease (patch repair protein)